MHQVELFDTRQYRELLHKFHQQLIGAHQKKPVYAIVAHTYILDEYTVMKN